MLKYPVPALLNVGLAITPFPTLTSIATSAVLLGSVSVIVGSAVYPEPGSQISMADTFASTTVALPCVLAPVKISKAVELGLMYPPIATNFPAPYVAAAQGPDPTVLLVHVTPSYDVAAWLDPVAIAKNVPPP